jgi:ABC-type sugar transport system ATPase subunit
LTSAAPILQLDAAVKTYPPNVRALRGVTLGIRAGEVTALLGANGAGKSTLARILTGVEQPTSGSLLIDGKPVRLTRPSDANRMGIAAVHQELPLLPNLTAVENISLGQTSQRFLSIWTPTIARRRYIELARGIPNAPPPDVLVGTLSIAQRQKVAFVRALSTEPRALIVDEGTSSLSIEERKEMQAMLRRLALERQLAVIYITHFIADALAGSDRILVLKDGELALDSPASQTRYADVLQVLGGAAGNVKSQSDTEASVVVRPGESARLDVDGLACDGVGAMSFAVNAGECVGLYGPPGCGANEALRAIAGFVSHRGSLRWNGEELAGLATPERVRRKVVYCNGDRAKNLMLRWTVGRNINLLYLFRQPLLALAARRSALTRAREVVRDFGIKGSAEELIRNLSGGNQQKVAVARAVSVGTPMLLIGDDLTRGVDIVGRSHIHILLREAVAKSAAILLYSTDPEELVALCDRVLVLRDGTIIQELQRPGIAVEALEGEVQRGRHAVA